MKIHATAAGVAIALASSWPMLGTSQPKTASPSPPFDTARIETITGLHGAMNAAEGVFKVTKPHDHLSVTVDGMPLPPFLGLTSWAAFQRGGRAEVLVAGDVVLLENQVAAAMKMALDKGLEVTALHNHFLHDEPRVMYMHICGEGTVEDTAKAVRAVMDVQEAPAAPPGHTAAAAGVPRHSDIPVEAVRQILGLAGTTKDGMYKAVIGDKVTLPCGCIIGADMGVNTWIAMAGTAESAVVDGDFVTFNEELQPVLKSLVGSGINVVAIHSHMEGETPHAIFLHYWGVGRAEALARAIKAALDAQKATAKSVPGAPSGR